MLERVLVLPVQLCRLAVLYEIDARVRQTGLMEGGSLFECFQSIAILPCH